MTIVKPATAAPRPVRDSDCFTLGVIGARLTQRFTEQVAALGITHKHAGVLAVIDAGLAGSQREIADRLQVAPSLVVLLLDQLTELGAVTRTRDSADRRVHRVTLTDRGRQLLNGCAAAAATVDADYRAALGPDSIDALERFRATQTAI